MTSTLDVTAELRRFAAYREALRLCEVSVERGGVTERDLIEEFGDLETAYHYAQRYAHFYTPALSGTTPTAAQKARHLASHKLAFEVVFELVDKGYEGLGYNSARLKYIPLPRGVACDDADFHKTYGMGPTTFPWCSNPWHALAAAEKLTKSIRRVKARTVEDVKLRLLVPLEARHGG
jgi:hypothetical protein